MSLNIDKIAENIVFPELKTRDCSQPMHQFFQDYELVTPESVIRPDGDTTLFTTSSIQVLETLENAGQSLPKRNIMVYQPCIRMQWINHVKQGTSTSFINFSAIHFNATERDFVIQTGNLIKAMANYGAFVDNINITPSYTQAEWGRRKFNESILALNVGQDQVSEIIFMHDYPHLGKKTNIIEIGMGIERIKWMLNNEKFYFSEFKHLYDAHAGITYADNMTNILDCIRTSVLIAASGVQPHYKNIGSKIRKIVKKFVSKSEFLGLDLNHLVETSYNYWIGTGIKFAKSSEETYGIIAKEVERNLHSLEIDRLEQQEGFKINLDINFPEMEFRSRLNKILHDHNLQKSRANM
jgi:hypothetical protein